MCTPPRTIVRLDCTFIWAKVVESKVATNVAFINNTITVEITVVVHHHIIITITIFAVFSVLAICAVLAW